MDDKAGALAFIGIIATCIGIPLLLLRHSSDSSQDFIEETPQMHSTKWVKTGKTYENTEHWHIDWDLENLIPTDITIKRHAVET